MENSFVSMLRQVTSRDIVGCISPYHNFFVVVEVQPDLSTGEVILEDLKSGLLPSQD